VFAGMLGGNLRVEVSCMYTQFHMSTHMALQSSSMVWAMEVVVELQLNNTSVHSAALRMVRVQY